MRNSALNDDSRQDAGIKRSKRMNKLKGAALLSAVGMLAAACGSKAVPTPTTTGSSATTGNASTAKPGPTLKIGVLYASSGSFAASSMPEYQGIKFWVDQENAAGGVYVQGTNTKDHIDLIAYNDQSDATTAGTLYNQLITQDQVDILLSDFGSVLTAPAVTLAQEHHVILFDTSGSGSTFFTKPNPYLVLTSLPSSAIWPKPAAEFLTSEKITKVAIVYCANDFDQSQANTIKQSLSSAGVNPVMFQAVPTTTSDYSTIIQSIKGTNPEAVIELGYQNNDIAFLNDLKQSGTHFGLVLTAFPTQLPDLFAKDVGPAGMAYTFGYGVPPVLKINNVNLGMGYDDFASAFSKSNGAVSFLNVAGYNTGLVIQDALAHAKSTSSSDIRAGVTAISGQLQTLTGTFEVNDTGAQQGELLPVAQDIPTSSGATNWQIVYPPSQAQTKAVYSAPANAG